MSQGIVIHVDGFALTKHEDDELRIRDVELAQALGYERPRAVRDLIARLAAEGELPGICLRRTVRRKEFGPKNARRSTDETVNEYWLDEIEALLVIMQSKAPKAQPMRRTMAMVFRQARRQADQVPADLRGPMAHLERYFLTTKAVDFELLWTDSFVREIERLHGREWIKGRHPYHLKSTYPVIYELIMSKGIADKLAGLNIDPKRYRRHQFIAPEARPFVVAQLSIVEAIAIQSANKAEFWQRLERQFRGAPLQLVLGGKTSRRLPTVTP
jgi:hypothetical protein